MKKILLFAVVLFSTAIYLCAQKKPFGHDVYDRWESVSSVNVPYNGRYALYSVHPQRGDGELVLLDLQTNHKVNIERASSAVISKDGDFLIYRLSPSFKAKEDARTLKGAKINSGDTLAIRNLVTGKTRFIPHIKAYRYGRELLNHIVYQDATKSQVQDNEKQTIKEDFGDPLYITDIHTNKVDTLDFVERYVMNDDATIIAYINKPDKKGGSKPRGLYLYSISDKSSTLVLELNNWAKIELPVFNMSSTSIAFYAQLDSVKASVKQYVDVDIYQYELDNIGVPAIVVSSESDGIPDGWMISAKYPLKYNNSGSYLKFGTSPRPKSENVSVPSVERVKLHVWAWDAECLPTDVNMKRSRSRSNFMALYHIDDKKVTQINDFDFPYLILPQNYAKDNIIVASDKQYRIQKQWDMVTPIDLYRIDLKTGKRELLEEKVNRQKFTASPNGNYYSWWEGNDYFLYDDKTAQVINITESVDDNFINSQKDTPGPASPVDNIIWFEDESAFILYSEFDVWEFVLDSNREFALKSHSITEEIGRKNKIKFTLVSGMYYLNDERSRIGINYNIPLGKNKPLYFASFNNVTKETGYYVKDITKKKAKLTRLIDGGGYGYRKLGISTFTKKPVYIFLKGNFEKPYDVYLSKDSFKTQDQLSNINTQQEEYCWGTAELVNWRTEDGITADGLLFKPEGFDPTKKYPLLVYFYERDSDGLYDYLEPKPMSSTINIPYFVSQGYVVFNPDIYYKNGDPGQSAMRSIMPGVDALCADGWVDEDNMAIQGHSWGGYQVAYIITQTDRFKCACVGAAVSNMISAYGGLRSGSGLSRQFMYESGQSRIGKNLWEAYDDYYRNSPIFFLPNVSTPILIMHNDNDGAVPWSQGVELFTGLRRLGKEAWMLQYLGEGHSLEKRYNCLDLSEKLSSFFDYYLKGATRPEWMQ